MKQRSIRLFVLIFIMAAFSTEATGFEFAAGGWNQDPGGDLSYKSTDTLDVGNDLKYDTQARLHGRAKIHLPLFLPNIYLMAAPSEFDGTGQRDVAFQFGDQIFQGNVPFYSKLTFNQYDVALYYGLPFLRTASLHKLNVDIGLNVRIVDLDAQVLQDGRSQKEDVIAAIPQLYIGMQLTPLDWLAIEAEGRGLAVGGNSAYSLIGRVRFNVFGPLFVAAGYRYDKLDVQEDDVDIEFTIQGPFAEIGLKF